MSESRGVFKIVSTLRSSPFITPGAFKKGILVCADNNKSNNTCIKVQRNVRHVGLEIRLHSALPENQFCHLFPATRTMKGGGGERV